MYHLTRNHKKLLRKNGSKVMLSLCVALALSGGLVSAEGNSIEVGWMGGGEGTIQEGTDETEKVTIHNLMTWGTPEAYVKGKQITVEDASNWGGKIFIGSDATDLVDVKGFQAGTDAETTIDGNVISISIGKLGTGSSTFTIGNKNTNSVVINDFGAGGNSETTINGHNVSVSNDKGQVNIYKGQVTIHTDGNFKVAQGENLQNIGVTEGGNLSITAGSLDAGALNVTNSNSKADIQVSTKGNLKDIGVTAGGNLSITAGSLNGNRFSIANKNSSAEISGKESIYFSNGLSVNDNSKVEMASPSIRVEGDSSNGLVNISADSSVKLDGNDLFVTGGLNIANSTLTAAETGTLELGKKDAYNCFTVTNSQVSLGSETSLLHLYGKILASSASRLYENTVVPSHVDIHGQEILIDGVYIDNNSYAHKSIDSILTNNDFISVGDNDSNVWLKGRLFNTGSDVTVNGRTIHISAADVINSDAGKGKYSQYAIEGTGDDKTKTTIGNENTESLLIDGATWINHGSLWMHGKNIDLSYAKGIALIGSNHEYHNPSKGTILLAGGKETENLTIKGQVANIGAAEMQLSGQHITIDSTGYDGSDKGGPYPESLLAFSNDIYAGTKDTQAISISSGLNALGGNIQVLGKDITVGTSGYFQTHKVEVWDEVNKKYVVLTDNYIAHAAGGNVTIGSDDADTDTVHLYGGQLLAGGGSISIQGKHISVNSSAAYVKPDSDYMNSEKYERLSAVHAAGGSVQIGSEQTDDVALRGGTLLADGENTALKVFGRTILIDSGNWWSGETKGGKLTIGSKDSDSDSISIHGKGGIYARGGAVDILGKQISIQADTDNALMNDGGPITVGGEDTESIDVSGGIVSHGSQISLEGQNVSISKGKQDNAIYTDGGSVTVKATGGDNEAHISGPITNDKGSISISLSGKPAYLYSSFKTNYDSGKTDLSLSDKASWNLSDTDSNFTTYTGDDGIIHLDNETHQTVTISEFNDKGTRIHEDIYGSKNTDNDTIHIDNSYTGNTHFWLVNRDDTDKGVVGTVLASALKKESGSTNGANALMIMAAMPVDPIAAFKANNFAAYGMSSLFFKTYGLGIKASDRQDYTKDLYITDVTNHTTNDKGQYTPTVSAAFSGSSLMYYTWRTENDKMLQRVGDLRENEGEETGLWTRIRGSRIGRDGYRGFKNQYKVYEIGYDAKTEDNDRMKSFTGIALSYLDGKGYYADGQGTNQATSAAIYHTDIHKTGHYLDLVFRIRHMNERFHTRDTVDTDIGPVTEDHSASLDTTGLSFSAEYGRKKFMGKGWYVEPQTQWTLGYLGPVQYEMDNGTRVEQPGITSFVGRAGFNLGRQVNENSIVYLKANVYHEFGGHSPLHLYAGDESLSFTDTFDDTWFEYGVGFAVKLGNGLSLYGDVEKTAGSHFYKDWQWNAGLRYSF